MLDEPTLIAGAGDSMSHNSHSGAVMVESRFRVANGMQEAVRAAFLARPGLVDSVAGFLSMETFVAHDDVCVFHLVTRWTDIASYNAWHQSEAHHDSHAFIPRGLKLDAKFTRVTVLDRIEALDAPQQLAIALSDAGPAIARWVKEADVICAAVIAAGELSFIPNDALAERLGVTGEGSGIPLEGILAHGELASLADRIVRLRAAGNRGTDEAFTLHFATGGLTPTSMRCRIDVQPRYTVLLAEQGDREEALLQDELLRANNELSVLAREREQQRKSLLESNAELLRVQTELASALEALETSYWHIRKINELLPMCMECGKVNADGDTWQAARDFLAASGLTPIVTHGYCPSCVNVVMQQFDAAESPHE